MDKAPKTSARPRVLSEILQISTTTGISPVHTPRGALSEALDPQSRARALSEWSFFSITQSPRSRSYSSARELAAQLDMENRLRTQVAFRIPKAPSPIAALMAEEDFLTIIKQEVLEAIRTKAHPMLQHATETPHLGVGTAVADESSQETVEGAEVEPIFKLDL